MKKVLIVEDEQAYLQLLHDQLVKRGHEVFDAHDGEEGLKLAQEKRPDLILLDLLMPKVGGLDMLIALRKSAWGEKIPVIVLTNVSGSYEITNAMYSNVSEYLIKSDVKLEDLIDDVQRFLEKG
ncbi:MAG: PleD family two-component system response regulator [Candidatus Levyibacteriota bacterium]